MFADSSVTLHNHRTVNEKINDFRKKGQIEKERECRGEREWKKESLVETGKKSHMSPAGILILNPQQTRLMLYRWASETGDITSQIVWQFSPLFLNLLLSSAEKQTCPMTFEKHFPVSSLSPPAPSNNKEQIEDKKKVYQLQESKDTDGLPWECVTGRRLSANTKEKKTSCVVNLWIKWIYGWLRQWSVAAIPAFLWLGSRLNRQ